MISSDSRHGPSGFSLLSILTAPGGSLRLSMATWARANSPANGARSGREHRREASETAARKTAFQQVIALLGSECHRLISL